MKINVTIGGTKQRLVARMSDKITDMPVQDAVNLMTKLNTVASLIMKLLPGITLQFDYIGSEDHE